MTTDLEQRLREAFHEDARHARLVNPDQPVDLDERRPGLHRGTHAGGWLVAAAVLVLAGVVGVRLFRDGDDPGREVATSPGPMAPNGRIVSGDGSGWPEGAAPPERPSGRGPDTHTWDGFDPVSGSFLYAAAGRIWVLDQDGDVKADFTCGSGACGGRAVLGPGADEVTLLASDRPSGWEFGDGLQVTGWDGTVRDTVDIAAAFTRDANGTVEQELETLAWSPDGTRLAVATVPGAGCDPLQDPCEGQVWTFGPHGEDPRLVYTARTDGRVEPGDWRPPEIGDLAWSPDGRSLGVVVAPQPLGDPTWPTLVVLRFQPDGTVRSDTLYDYERPGPPDSYLMQMWYEHTFPFAWSPDGTRIAVGVERGVEEISAEDGRVLAEHPGVGVDDEGHSLDVAWLPPEDN